MPLWTSSLWQDALIGVGDLPQPQPLSDIPLRETLAEKHSVHSAARPIQRKESLQTNQEALIALITSSVRAITREPQWQQFNLLVRNALQGNPQTSESQCLPYSPEMVVAHLILSPHTSLICKEIFLKGSSYPEENLCQILNWDFDCRIQQTKQTGAARCLWQQWAHSSHCCKRWWLGQQLTEAKAFLWELWWKDQEGFEEKKLAARQC